MIIQTEGIVVKRVNYSDDDLILTIYTKEFGNIVALARGARKNKSKYLSCAQLLVKAQYDFYKGKKYYSINNSEILNGHYKIRENLKTYAYGMFSAELIVKLLLEEDENKRIYAMFDKYLEKLILLDDDCISILNLSFMVKLISMIGYRIDYSEVDNSNSKFFFNIGQGTITSIPIDSFFVELDSKVINFLIRITYIKFEEVVNIDYNREIVQILQKILLDYIYYHTDIRELKSLSFIKDIEIY